MVDLPGQVEVRSYEKGLLFRRAGDEIIVQGIDLGTHTYVKFERAGYQVWHTPSYRFWNGLYLPWMTAPACWRLVKVTSTVSNWCTADVLASCEPGRDWYTAKLKMIASIPV